MSLKVVDREKRLASRPGGSFRHHRPDNQTANQSGTGCRGDPVDLVERNAGLVERVPDQRCEVVEMGAGRDLGYDPAVMAVLVELRTHQIGADAWLRFTILNHGGGGFVAARFEAQDD